MSEKKEYRFFVKDKSNDTTWNLRVLDRSGKPLTLFARSSKEALQAAKDYGYKVDKAKAERTGHGYDGMRSMTYGILPSRADFDAAFERECPDGTYSIRNDKGGADGDYTASKLWALVKESAELLNDDGDEEAGDFASAVLSTLGFEWI